MISIMRSLTLQSFSAAYLFSIVLIFIDYTIWNEHNPARGKNILQSPEILFAGIVQDHRRSRGCRQENDRDRQDEAHQSHDFVKIFTKIFAAEPFRSHLSFIPYYFV